MFVYNFIYLFFNFVTYMWPYYMFQFLPTCVWKHHIIKQSFYEMIPYHAHINYIKKKSYRTKYLTDIDAASLNTIAPNFFLSIWVLSASSSISLPNSLLISSHALLPGSYTTCASLSASFEYGVVLGSLSYRWFMYTCISKISYQYVPHIRVNLPSIDMPYSCQIQSLHISPRFSSYYYSSPFPHSHSHVLP